ncbi:family 71 glycosyltransferase [Cryphonectria parasitica EP155]|uniref:Family 71 glycosyltransferase n=1 Tax=Cryphonectria parasitica (strain ATCC 38755 / EP155) TaxID=660469 RepID=A0A9P5CNA8_CRYP1|nr:family 71 glycosyltransferase [Cryphonectria parasitica EP155]KAF3765259.1 family 71 glycosyltransferase [Cryphonectria parasitica EP155]
MFKPLSLKDVPLKEGRLPLAVPSPREPPSKHNQRVRQIALVVLVVLVVRSAIFYWSSSSSASYDGVGSLNEAVGSVPRTGTAPAQTEETHFPTLDVDTGKVSEEGPQGLPPHKPHQVPLASKEDGLGRTASKSPAEVHFSPRPGFNDALFKIINLLPSELEMRGLLRPIELTGEQRLRELGMLARKYKKYFDAWEDLHVVTDSDGGYEIRDDVIPFLRYQASTASSSIDHVELVNKIHAYEGFRRLLVQLDDLLFPFTAPYFPDHMTLRSHLKKGGRGIVLTAGNDQVTYLLTQIPILRQLGCNLPIEVMYVGDNDLNRDSRQDLEDIEGVITRDIGAMVNPVGWNIASWAAKPFAILLSSFREVIFIDADSFFFKNPEVMFDYPEYVDTGALFFRDRLIMPESKKSWLQSILPQPVSRNVKQSRLWKGESGHQQESGVLVVDTHRHFLAMLFVLRMNGPDREGDKSKNQVGVYDMVYGDKETFWLGFELVGDTDYAFHQGDAGIIGELEESQDTSGDLASTEGNDTDTSASELLPREPPKPKICSPQLLHLDTQGKPLWFNGGLVRNKFLDRREWKFGSWDSFLIEPRDIREPGAWFLGDANMCCLTTDHHLKGELSTQEKDLLADMVKQARKIGIAT